MNTATDHVRRAAPESTPRRRPLTIVEEAPAPDLANTIARALTEARAARHDAERRVHVAEARRADAARALERDLRPMRLDEAARAALRDAYTVAADEAARARSARDDAATVEQALVLAQGVPRPGR